MLLAFAASYALCREGRFLGETDSLHELGTSRRLAFHEHRIVAAEDPGDINALGTRHAIAASRASHFLLLADLLLYHFESVKIFLRQMTRRCLGGSPAVFLHHLHRIHAGQDNCHFRLVVQPAQSPFRRGPAAPARLHRLKGAGRQHIYQFAASQRLHDDHRDPFSRGSFQALHAGLSHFVEVVVLDLAEIPVIVVQNLQEVLRVAVIRESDISNFAARFFGGDPVKNTDRLEFLPHGDICQMMHQVIINICCPQP